MPTCRKGYHLASHVLTFASGGLAHVNTFALCRTRLRRPNAVSRFLATRAPSPFGGAGQILTLAYKTKNLVSQILPSVGPGIAFTESSGFWEDVLTTACDKYESVAELPASVVVYGADRWSCSEDVVTSLLFEPLASDNAVNEVLRTRHRQRPMGKPLTISCGRDAVSNADSMQIPSTYLQQFTTAIQVTEAKSQDMRTLSQEDVLLLFKADIPIIVVNPITTPLIDLLQFRLPSNAILALIAPTITTPDHLNPLLASASTRSREIIYLDPSRAVKVLAALHADSTSLSTIQRYQDDFVGSGLSSITQILRHTLGPPSESPLAILRADVVLTHIRGALATCRDKLSSAKTDAASVLSDISSLTTQIEEARRHAPVDIFGSSHAKKAKWGSVWPLATRSRQHDPPTTGVVKQEIQTDEIAEALAHSRRRMHDIMDNLTWWRMLWRVDEISSLVHAAVEQTWYSGLEKKLTMHTGRLASSQQDFAAQTFSILAKYKGKPPFDSALLHNSLHQKHISPSYRLTPSTLVEPLHKRKSQLIEYPTTQLHLGGQQTVVGLSAGLLTSTTFSWAGWLGWLSGAGPSAGTDSTLLQAITSMADIGIEPTTAIGLGLFGTLASMRWAAGKWERTKKRWWEDWQRLSQGLERDLKVTLENVMKEKVTVVADSGCAAFHQLAEARENEIAKLDKELEALLSNVDSLQEESRRES